MQINRSRAQFAILAEFERRLSSYERVRKAALLRQVNGWQTERDYKRQDRDFRFIDRTPRVLRG